jgi:hypothetical protein
MMKPDLKEKWLAALRSGDYRQAKTALRTDENEFCCLGVLCDVFDQKQWSRDEESFGDWSFRTPEAYDYPDAWTHRATGLISEQGRYLAEMNDAGKSFADIADWIETYVLAQAQDKPQQDQG